MSLRLGELFDAGGAEFVAWSPRLWEPLGAALVRIADPHAGERVLDACCGAGASALPAARAVGVHGWVDGVDLARRLLAHARRTAADSGLVNVRFSAADVMTWSADSGNYDLVQCGYGLHLLPDMTAGGRHLVSLLRAGGRLAVATAAQGAFEPLLTALAAALARESDDGAHVVSGPRQAERLDNPEKLADYLASIGLSAPEVTVLPFHVGLHDPRATWQLVTGSALRFLLTGLSPDALARVRVKVLAGLHAHGVVELAVPTLLGRGYRLD